MKIISRDRELFLFFLVIDVLILNVTYALTYFIQSEVIYSKYPLNFNPIGETTAWILTYFIFSRKDLYLTDGFNNRIIRLTSRTFNYIIISTIYLNFLLSVELNMLYIFFVVLFYLNSVIVYGSVYISLKNLRSKGKFTKNTLILGVNPTASLLAKIIKNNPILGYKFIGFISRNNEKKDPKILGTTDDIIAILDHHYIHLVFITVSIFENQLELKQLFEHCINKGIRVRLVPIRENFFGKSSFKNIGGISIIDPIEIPLDDYANRIKKRLFDILFSVFVIVFILSWLLPILSLIIKLDSRGPIFFIQKRTGINNKTFQCYKFRSMKIGSDKIGKQVEAGDIRTTNVGRFIRRWNLDEFPQFINVLFGNMSIVGPRPHMLLHTQVYSESILSYKARHLIKPGITGLAQINGLRGETKEIWKMEQRIKYDLDYIENWTFIKDIEIILKTLFSRKSYKNAY